MLGLFLRHSDIILMLRTNKTVKLWCVPGQMLIMQVNTRFREFCKLVLSTPCWTDVWSFLELKLNMSFFAKNLFNWLPNNMFLDLWFSDFYIIQKLSWPHLFQLFMCCININPCWAQPNQAEFLEWLIKIKKRANNIARSRLRGHLFVYSAMRYGLSSPFNLGSLCKFDWVFQANRLVRWVLFSMYASDGRQY